MSLYNFIGKITPMFVRKRYKEALKYSMVKSRPTKFIGKIIVWGVLIAVGGALAIQRYYEAPVSVLFFALFLAIQFAIYMWVLLSGNTKANLVEESLPDALQLMSSNIRAGLTTDKALIMAARPEFGPLEEEIRRIGKETMAGKNLTDSLKKTNDHVKSKDLERTIELIVFSLQSGGQLADLLDQTADDIRDQQMLKKEISASVLMYVMFIFIAITIGAPVLFSLSSFLVQMLTENMGMIAEQMPSDFGSAGGSMPISVNESQISPEFIMKYSLASIFASCFFGSMVMGLIMKGEEKEGLKYLIIMAIIAVSLFFLGKTILHKVLGGMLVGG